MSTSGESSTMMHRLLHASGSQPISPPDDPKSEFTVQGEHHGFSDLIIFFSGILLFAILLEMASSLITNALQVNFDSVLGIQDNEGMELERFFDTAIVQDGDITCAVFGKYVTISEDMFGVVFNLPTDGLTDLSEVPNHLVMQERTVFVEFGRSRCYFGEAKTFLSLKILSTNTVNTYVATNKTIDSRGESDEPEVANVAIVKKKAVSKKRPTAVSEEVVVKNKRTTSGKDVSKEMNLALMSVAQDVEPISVEPTVETVVVEQKEQTSIDGVDTIIEEVIAATAQLEADIKEPVEPKSEDITVEIFEESMSIEDLLLQIPVDAILPQIAATDKGKEPLVVDTIQGHPAREIFSLICADIEFLVQFQEQVIEAVATFFNSFSIRRLTALGSLETIAAKEEKVLNWGEDFVQTTLQRRARRHNFLSGTPTTAIDLKVLELLTTAHHFSLKFLLRQVKEHKLEWTRPSNSLLFEGDDIDRGYFIPRNHRTIFSTCWIRTKMLVDGSWLIVEGVDYWRPIMRPVDSRNWELQPKRPYIDDLAPLCAFVEPVQDIDSRAPFSRVVCDLWAEVCVGVGQFSLIGGLCSVSTINRCRDIVGPLVNIEEIPTGFRGLFQRGLHTNSFATFLVDFVEQPEENILQEDESSSSDDSVVYHSPSLDAEPSVQTSPVVDIALVPRVFASLSSRNSDLSFPSPHQSLSSASSMHFTDDIIQGTETAVEQTSLRTQSKIGDLQNAIFSKIDNREKATTEACIEQDQSFQGLIKNILQGVQTDTAALSIEMHEFKKAVRAQNAFVTTDLADLRKEVKDLKADLSKEFDDKLAVIRNDLLEFRVETQGQLASLGTNLAELIAFVTKGRDAKKGEVSSSHGRGQPPLGDCGCSGSKSEPSRKRGSSGSRQKSWRY
ncbi:hypothetical protein F511_29532 [Dorcoceras hygrometricum]|uniref:Uncharacterized protein n=1 Tax=Dorcoceras hygrometricum TaxID=472368 RepID=A0A2Z7A403_9LAMI|nr:hypothetical protein F511_29532 [Dorcoceras hygrometricum]